MLLASLKFMSLVPPGFGFGNLFATLHSSAETLGFPRLGVATMLVAIPTLVNLFNALTFLIGVTIYGF